LYANNRSSVRGWLFWTVSATVTLLVLVSSNLAAQRALAQVSFPDFALLSNSALDLAHTKVSMPYVPPPPPQSAASAQQVAGQSGFGVAMSDTLQHMNDVQMDATLNDLKSVGFKWIRFDMVWASVQPNGPSTFKWAEYDRIVTAARAKGFSLLPTLAYAPAWARQSACASSDTCAPTDMSQFAAFAHAAAAHYAGQGVVNWEVWNEPNLKGFWLPAPDAVSYTGMLKATYLAIKSAEPGAVVITGGTGSLDGRASSIEQRVFLRQMYAAGAKPYFDAVGYHPYSYPVLASSVRDWSGWSKMSDLSDSLRSIMTANGDGGKVLWLTEYGAPTGGPGKVVTPTGYNEDVDAPDHEDEAMQANTVTDSVKYVRASSWIGPMFWYSYQDRSTDSSSNENFFGLLRADGSRKPAYTAFKQLLNP
jgi:hypothetical protein